MSSVRFRYSALGSRYVDSIKRRQRKLSQRIKTSRQCPRNWCKSSNFLYSLIAQLAEYLTVNQSVPGSSPGGGARAINSAVRVSALHAESPRFKSVIAHCINTQKRV